MSYRYTESEQSLINQFDERMNHIRETTGYWAYELVDLQPIYDAICSGQFSAEAFVFFMNEERDDQVWHARSEYG